jgi:predicted Fe-Mo cluster-binding NifX family protein
MPLEWGRCEMKVAVSQWRGRISPVFDVARSLLLVDVDEGRESGRREFDLDGLEEVQTRADTVVRLGTNVLVCGAISWPLEMALSTAGVEVLSQTCGEVDDVVAAFVGGRFTEESFLMPGCCGRRRRGRGRLGWGDPIFHPEETEKG